MVGHRFRTAASASIAATDLSDIGGEGVTKVNIYRVSDAMSAEEAALVEPAAVAICTCDRAGVRAGSSVLVTGAGPIGMPCVLAARAAGATRVFLSDPNVTRLELARSIDSDVVTIDPTQEKVGETIRAQTEGEVGADIAIEAIGNERALGDCVAAVRRQGVVGRAGGRAGFRLDWGADGSGLFMKYLRRGSGYYIDIGASQLIIDGRIKLKAGQVEAITETGVRLDDGTQLSADAIVYATGYGSMNGWAADLISQEVADKVGKCWGLGSDTPKDPGPWEGEQRNMWKPTQQEALWFHGGNLHQSRHYSLYLALQLKARMEALPIHVYALQESHHRK